MKFNVKAIAAAVALVAASGAANALDLMPTQNSSLAFIGWDSTAQVSILVDLEYNLNDFLPSSAVNAPGTSIVWNFNNNTITYNGDLLEGTRAWSDPFASFQGLQSGNPILWAVTAGDSILGHRYLTTGDPTQDEIESLTGGLITSMGLVNNLYAANLQPVLGGTHSASTPGASVASPGTYAGAYAGGQWFQTNGKWVQNLTWSAWASEGDATKFQFITNSNPATITTYGNPNVERTVALANFATFTYDDGVLTWQAAPVPEPGTYALLLAGLGVIGFVARRRRAS